jgi:hypothetical protein
MELGFYVLPNMCWLCAGSGRVAVRAVGAFAHVSAQRQPSQRCRRCEGGPMTRRVFTTWPRVRTHPATGPSWVADPQHRTMRYLGLTAAPHPSCPAVAFFCLHRHCVADRVPCDKPRISLPPPVGLRTPSSTTPSPRLKSHHSVPGGRQGNPIGYVIVETKLAVLTQESCAGLLFALSS